jgi:hypothetical protein
MFNRTPWLEIPSDQRGTQMLKRHLAELLCRRIREAFPGMEETVSKLLEAEKMKRKNYGDARSGRRECAAYLMNIANSYHDYAKKALSAPGDLPFDDIKLRGQTEAEKEQFTINMMQNGLKHRFVEIGNPIELEYDPDDSDSEDDDTQRMSVVSHLIIPTSKILTNHEKPLGNLKHGANSFKGFHITPASSPPRKVLEPNHIPTKLSPLYAEIQRQMRTNRGEELPGMLNPAVLRPLWRIQTCGWVSKSD